ncbi:hypothetical protein E3Q01_02386 [Wallemia mellicola]|uniref:Mediator of RNA polymerase II transcription subunit 4 n=1 Tax=Wallemia mellicola TaxID=1708541 RepID=A0A4T0TJK6_9BASI|nr:hypothetical protein E3Q01_02386 [Wallemia mellicola]
MVEERTRDSVLNTIKEIDAISQSIFSSISSQAVKPLKLNASQISSLSRLDELLAVQLEELREHEYRQQLITELENDIVDLESNIQSSLHILQSSQKDLDKILKDGDKDIERIHATENNQIPDNVLLEYAQKLSAFTHAPPTINSADTIQHPSQQVFNVPFPTESNMRRGILFAQSVEEGQDDTLKLEMGESKQLDAEIDQEHHYNSLRNQQEDMQAGLNDGDVEFDLLD